VVSSQRHGGELVQPQGGAAVSGGRTSNARIQRGGLARRFNSERMTYLPRCGRLRVRPTYCTAPLVAGGHSRAVTKGHVRHQTTRVHCAAWSCGGPLVARAQQPKKVPRLCFLTFDPGTLQSTRLTHYLSADGRGELFPAPLPNVCASRQTSSP
jgi:hypothetical protein